MKAIALANRLARDLDEKSVIDLTADVKLEILDAINGGLQRLDSLAPFQSRTTTASLFLDAPLTVQIGLTKGSTEITGYTFNFDQYWRTIRIEGDTIDNHVSGESELRHPYGGATGTHTAVIYGDAVAIPEIYVELVGEPSILETGKRLTNYQVKSNTWQRKTTAIPSYYWMESNARNQSQQAPTVMRFDSLPDQDYRLEVEVSLAPARVVFTDLLSSGAELPIRTEHVESYLLPIARGLLSNSSLWKDKEGKASAREDAKNAEIRYELMVPKTLATPYNRSRTKPGF